MSVLLFLLSLPAVAFTVSGLRPLSDSGRGAPWLIVLAVTELTLVAIAAHLAVGAVFLAFGWTAGWVGTVGILLLGASTIGLVVIQARTAQARSAIEAGVSDLLGEPVSLPSLAPFRLLDPRPKPPIGVRRHTGVQYGPDSSHRLEVVSGPLGAGLAPVLLQIHGGGWTGGRIGRQGRPLLYRMAGAGWVVVEMTYRLSPRATFPDHLVDVKRAIAWIRRNASELGADRSFVAVTGGSAGGQLAALAAMTQNDPELQPGFEDADTSLQACVPVYGVHDMLDPSGQEPRWPYLATAVLDSYPAEEPDRWALASPIDVASAHRPPFLVVHGREDSLVHPSDSTRLVNRLREKGGPPVGHIEIPWATHGFDTFDSVRALHHAEGVAVALEALWADHLVDHGRGRV